MKKINNFRYLTVADKRAQKVIPGKVHFKALRNPQKTEYMVRTYQERKQSTNYYQKLRTLEQWKGLHFF